MSTRKIKKTGKKIHVSSQKQNRFHDPADRLCHRSFQRPKAGRYEDSHFEPKLNRFRNLCGLCPLKVAELIQPTLKLRLVKAERVGFEPTIPLRVYKLSRLALSTTQTPLLILNLSVNRQIRKSMIYFNLIELFIRCFPYYLIL